MTSDVDMDMVHVDLALIARPSPTPSPPPSVTPSRRSSLTDPNHIESGRDGEPVDAEEDEEEEGDDDGDDEESTDASDHDTNDDDDPAQKQDPDHLDGVHSPIPTDTEPLDTPRQSISASAGVLESPPPSSSVLPCDIPLPPLQPAITQLALAEPSAAPTLFAAADQGSSAASKPGSTAKPRVQKKLRTPCPSPPPILPLPPLTTIRLEIKLGGPSNYEVNISRQAKETGQRQSTPAPVERSKRHSSDESGNEPKGKGKVKDEDTDRERKEVKKRKKKNVASEYYDISDPFIDDSELAIDERTYFAQTKQQGFYVSSGEVALLKDKTSKKPKSKKLPLLAPLPPEKPPGNAGTRSSPIALEDEEDGSIIGGKSGRGKEDEKQGNDGAGSGREDEENGGDDRVGQKRKRYLTVVEGGKKRKVVDVHSFHQDLQVAIEKIKTDISQETWTPKGKFPPGLKPKLEELAILAIKLDEYDEDFFNLMPTLFPYNKFTMSKLIRRTVFQGHTALLMARQDALLEELASLVQQGFEKVKDEWTRSLLAWDKRQEKAREETVESGAPPPSQTLPVKIGSESGAPTRQTTEEMDGTGEGAAACDANDGKDAGGHNPPGKKYRLTERMKAMVWQLVLLSNECCRLENERNKLEGLVIQVSEQGLRKVLYQKIVAAFPEGWMSSGQISRDVSTMKKRFEKEALENGD